MSKKRPNKIEITFSDDEMAQLRKAAEFDQIPMTTFARRAVIADAIRFIKHGESHLRFYRPSEYTSNGLRSTSDA